MRLGLADDRRITMIFRQVPKGALPTVGRGTFACRVVIVHCSATRATNPPLLSVPHRRAAVADNFCLLVAMDSAAAHASPSSHSLRQHSHFSSPSTNRIATSASTSSATPSSHTVNGEDAIVSIPITIDDALGVHAEAPDPMRAALEAILAERNSLSAQNSQLWNHLKRQRANYASAVKDVVRLRSERDALRAKVNGSDNTEGPSQINGRKLRTTVSSAAMSTNEIGSGRERVDLSKPGSSRSPQNPRASMTRHQSDDTPGSHVDFEHGSLLFNTSRF